MTQRWYKHDIYIYRKVTLSPFHNGKVEYCTISGSRDIEENASANFFYSDFINGIMTVFDERVVISGNFT